MAIFRSRLTHQDAERLIRDNARLTSERDELKARLQTADQTIWNQSQELIAIKTPQPASWTDITAALRGYVPSVHASPGYSAMQKAATPDAFASAIHTLMLDAHRVGFNDAKDSR